MYLKTYVELLLNKMCIDWIKGFFVLVKIIIKKLI